MERGTKLIQKCINILTNLCKMLTEINVQKKKHAKGARLDDGGTVCAPVPGDPWVQYIRSGPEGAKGVFGCVALSLSFSFPFDSFFLSLIL